MMLRMMEQNLLKVEASALEYASERIDDYFVPANVLIHKDLKAWFKVCCCLDEPDIDMDQRRVLLDIAHALTKDIVYSSRVKKSIAASVIKQFYVAGGLVESTIRNYEAEFVKN